MITRQLYPYCLYYKQEIVCPNKYIGKLEGELWDAEKFVIENLFSKVDEKEPQKSMATLVLTYFGKWNPYQINEAFEEYSSKIPELKDFIYSLL